jgi:hypothetical protein
MRRFVIASSALMVTVGCASPPFGPASAPTPSVQILAPAFDVLLPQPPVITPDQAIQRAKETDNQGVATSVQAFLEVAVPDSSGGLVITPGAKPSPPNVVVWDVVWKGVCIVPNGVEGEAPIPSCAPNHTWHTMIDATSGEWISSGTGTPDEG